MSETLDLEREFFAHNGGVRHESCADCERIYDEIVAAWRRRWKERARRELGLDTGGSAASKKEPT